MVGQDFNCVECRDELVNDIHFYGLKVRDELGDHDFANICFQTALKAMNAIKLAENFRSQSDPRYYGRYYLRLAKIYVDLNNREEACKCMDTGKLLWPEAYNYMKKHDAAYVSYCP